MPNDPRVTVIMPIRNEAAFIERSLGAVLAQDYPPEQIEVLIADGMSDDRTCDIIRQITPPDRVTIIPNPKRHQAAGLNLAIFKATGDYIIRVDGHTVIAADYVRTCVRILQETGAQNVGGAMNPAGLTPMGRAIAAAGKSAFAVPSAFHVSSQPAYTDTVYLGAWPRDVLVRLGGYNEHVGVNEDYELNYRIRSSGGKVFYSPAICSTYYGRQTLRALARQYFRYGASKVAMLRLHPGSLRLRQMVAPLFVAGLVVGMPLALLHPVLSTLYISAVLSYIGLSLVFTLRVMARTNDVAAWTIPLVFLVIHLSWGVGFWMGGARQWAIRNRPA